MGITDNLDMQTILDQVEYLFRQYSLVRRKTTQPYMLELVVQKLNDYQYSPDDDLVLETLIEHVGSLPMLATALYPHINDTEVDLGRALSMLAIHDIGELETGDEMVFTKHPNANIAERKAALRLLHPSLHALYHEAEAKQTKSAKFAKAIDKINPDIIDYLMPAEITKQRYKFYVGVEPDEIISTIVKHKRPHMIWNPFMTEFHDYLMTKLQQKLSQTA